MDLHFRTLGLQRGCSEADLKKAYRAKALLFHPDRNPNGAEAFKQVHTAYEALEADFKARRGTDSTALPHTHTKGDHSRPWPSTGNACSPPRFSRSGFNCSASPPAPSDGHTRRPSRPAPSARREEPLGSTFPGRSARPAPAFSTGGYGCHNNGATGTPSWSSARMQNANLDFDSPGHPPRKAPFTPRTKQDPTEALYQLSMQAHPNIHLVWACIDAGGEAVFQGKPVLNGFILSGCVAAVIACLTMRHPIDFTATDGLPSDRTPLHALCATSSDHDGYMLLGIVDRLENTIGASDAIDWDQKDGIEGLDFISYAGMKGKLWLFWPMIKESVPHFSPRRGPVQIACQVFGWDWRRLSEEDHARFAVPKGLKGY